jgi:hypothetical protein
MPTQEQKDASNLGQQAIALAEQLGRIAGTIEGKAEAWLNRPALVEQLTRVRDGAAELLQTLTDGAEQGRKAATASVQDLTADVRRAASDTLSAVAPRRSAPKQNQSKRKSPAPAASRTRSADPAHAPGKRHRKPVPTARGVKKSDESIPKQRTAAAVRQRRKSYA